MLLYGNFRKQYMSFLNDIKMKSNMKPRSLLLSAIFIFYAAVFSLSAEEFRLPAFPGAEGFGAFSLGGRGGRVIYVTNLKDYSPEKEKSVPGSFRAACMAKSSRIVVFAVSGTIPLKTNITITEPFITIAGQTAPGDGICLKNAALNIRTNNVIIRNMRFRPGAEYTIKLNEINKKKLDKIRKIKGKIPWRLKWKYTFEPDAMEIQKGSQNIIIDHCSASWGMDEVLSVAGGVDITNVTVQWCIISEGLNINAHSKGSLIKCSGDVTFHHNLYAHHADRAPYVGTIETGCILLDFRNNLIYDAWGHSGRDSNNEPSKINYIGNFIRFKKEPRRENPGYAFQVRGDGTKMYVVGNKMDCPGSSRLLRLIVGARKEWRRGNKMEKPFHVAYVKTESADDAFESITESAGAIFPKRDIVDMRIVKETRNGKGHVIGSEKDVDGWPVLESKPAPEDSDLDGMPDAWERECGLDPEDPRDGAKDRDGDGYTNIEEYINGLCEREKIKKLGKISGTEFNPPRVRKNDFINKWLVLGPFPYRGNIQKGLEHSFINETKNRPGTGTVAGGRKWQRLYTKWPSVNMTNIDGFDKNNVVAYAHVYILSPRKQKTTFYMGSDDACRAWVNGKKIINSGNVQRGFVRFEESGEAELNKGINSLLVKIVQGPYSWEFGGCVKGKNRLGLKFMFDPE